MKPNLNKKINKKINILVTGVGGPAGINICKLLQKYKKYFNIFGVDINLHSAGQFFSHQYFIGERVADEKKYLAWTKNFIFENKIQIVIPTVAEELVLMHKLSPVRYGGKKDNFKIIVSSKEVLELCDEKDKLYKWMTENLKEYMGLWHRLNIKKIPMSGTFWKQKEFFIKPVKGRGSRGCRMVSKQELKYLLKNNSKEMQDFIAMEVLPGREWTVDAYVNDDGSFAYVVPRLRLGLSGGISSLGKTDNNKQVIETATKIFQELQKIGKLYGPVFVQLKEGKNKNGILIPKMVEVNPRASGGLTITALSGANFADCLFSEIIDNKPCTNIKFKEVLVTRYFEEKVVIEKNLNK